MTLDVDRATFQELATVTDPTVLHVTASLPTVDPVTIYDTLVDGPYGFLLESAPKTAAHDPDGAFSADPPDRHTRYSFIGYAPDAVITVTDGDATVDRRHDTPAAARVTPGDGDTLDTLRTALPDLPRRGFPDRDRQHLHGGLVGFLAYDAVYDLWLDADRPDTRGPDAEFVLTTATVSVDHATDTTRLVLTPVLTPATDPDTRYDALTAEATRVRQALTDATPPAPDPPALADPTATPRSDYETAVKTAKQAVRDGEIYQGVLSRPHTHRGDIDPLALYTALREENPSPYMYLLGHEDRTVVGASPETLISVQADTVTANPIAGTCPRGDSPVEDRRLAGEMLADEKERAEHTMLVDLARNDVRRVSRPGSIAVPEFMSVLKYSHVQHIESTVTGRLRDDQDAFDAIRAAFPAGTLSGAPKIRAMELIHTLEDRPRGIYGGGVGYVDWTGDADTAIAIRTATIDHGATDTVRVRAGAGIVADSDPTAEYHETESKMDSIHTALARIEDPEPPR
ncbi:MAG: anthranilate synthase component I [Halobacteriaceae archaeon]